MADTATEEGESVVETIGGDAALGQRAARVIRNNVVWSMGAGVIPIAFVDVAAIMAVQIKLLKQLSGVYGVPFRVNLGKSAVAALIGGLTASGLTNGLLSTSLAQSVVRGIPIVGPLMAWSTLPTFAAAVTYAVGKVFEQHFASGGTFLTFDPTKVDDYFREKFEEAKKGGPTKVAREAA